MCPPAIEVLCIKVGIKKEVARANEVESTSARNSDNDKEFVILAKPRSFITRRERNARNLERTIAMNSQHPASHFPISSWFAALISIGDRARYRRKSRHPAAAYYLSAGGFRNAGVPLHLIARHAPSRTGKNPRGDFPARGIRDPNYVAVIMVISARVSHRLLIPAAV